MRELALAGFVAVAFGLGSFYATDDFGTFSFVNLALGGVALLVAVAGGARRLRSVGGPHSRPVIARGLLWIVVAIGVAVGAERLAQRADPLDWTFEGRFEPAEATVDALEDLKSRGTLEIDLFHDPLDPRIRRTRLLIETLARYGNVSVRELSIDEVPEEVDAYGIGSSNSLVLRLGDDYEVVERPTEGAIYEALYRLRSIDAGVLVMLRGEGEGDPEREDVLGFAGLATALATEGYRIRSLVSPAMSEVPDDADAVIVLAPRRLMPTAAIEALGRYLDRGGRLVALLEPGVETGLEPLLASWGIESLDGVLIDPASGAVENAFKGTCPVAYNYELHPATTGLDRNRMTFFCGVRSFRLRKQGLDDRLNAVVQSSPQAWLSDDLSVLTRRSGEVEPGPDIRPNYHPIAVTAQIVRDGRETRIFAVGDGDFASNRYLRALYNLDLMLNSVHWVVQREPAITLRPKSRDTIQFPLPIANSLRTLYGVGLLLPELLLIVGGVVWLRRRAA